MKDTKKEVNVSSYPKRKRHDECYSGIIEPDDSVEDEDYDVADGEKKVESESDEKGGSGEGDMTLSTGSFMGSLRNGQRSGAIANMTLQEISVLS